MSTIKFVYRSQNIPDTKPIEGSNKTITSGAVYTALNNIQMDTLFKSGYLPEGVASIVPSYKLTYESSELTLQTTSKVYIPNGKAEDEFTFNEVIVETNASNSNSFSDNFPAYVFYNSEDNTLVARTKRVNTVSAATGEPQNRTIQQVWAQKTEPSVAQDATSNGVIWWDTNENFIKVYNSSTSTWEVKQYSIPLALVKCSNKKITGIEQNFVMAGYCDNTSWINPGVTFVVATGIDETTGRYTNEMLETTGVIAKEIFVPTAADFSDYSLYINIDGEIEGAVEEYSFDYSLGLFIDTDNNTHKACRYSSVSAKHLTTNSGDPLVITDFVIRPILSLADNDDIEYVIKLIGSSMGVTIDDLQKEIDAAAEDREKIRQEMEEAIKKAKDEVSADMHHVMVHRQLPDGYVESVLNEDIKLDETIKGTKTFEKTIIGNISGTSQNVNISQGSSEIIPLGLNSYNAEGANSIQYINTDVRIGADYVKASKFNGLAMQTNWADLAEKYETDKEYPVGTLVMWGGEKELTLANYGIANAVISECPGYLMNSDGDGQPIALAGRVRVRVLGAVKKHDAIVLNELAPGVGKVQNNPKETIIARALEDNPLIGEKLVLCVVKFSL